MLVIPSIDLYQGKVVRLYQGRFDREKDYHFSPEQVLREFARKGARLVHIVDLEGARKGEPVHKELIIHLAKISPSEIEVGGGIRAPETVAEYLEAGVGRVILGTVAHSQPELVEELVREYPGRIVIGIDAFRGRVSVAGWEEETGWDFITLAKRYDREGIRAIIYTEIERDGTLKGPNISGVEELLKAVKVPVIASGGISSLNDLLLLKPYQKWGLEGVIVGKAIYEGKIDLKEAIKFLED